MAGLHDTQLNRRSYIWEWRYSSRMANCLRYLTRTVPVGCKLWEILHLRARGPKCRHCEGFSSLPTLDFSMTQCPDHHRVVTLAS